MIPQPKNAELFIGIVARLGVDTKAAALSIQENLNLYDYSVTEIKVTSALSEIPEYNTLNDLPAEKRYESSISACNDLRRKTGTPDLMARFAISQIAGDRQPSEDVAESRAALLTRSAFIINQLKREEESELLRSTYGEHYVQISFHSGTDQRARQLADRIADDHAEQPRAENWLTNARALMDRDDAEEDVPFGQRVRDVFPLSDVVIDATSEKSMNDGLDRFFRALFGDPRVTPSREEYGMQLANTASLRSADLSRQVGAAALNEHSEVQALGCNEVPKAHGGTYWEGDDPDSREFQLGKDSNDERKKEILLDVAARMADAGILSAEFKDAKKLRRALFERKDNKIKDAQIMDSLEYGRTVHAEMNAITDAARNGHALRGCTLFVNTFPCHNCAKHIIAAGIGKVIYLRPYPKSYARQLFPDSIAIDPSSPQPDKLEFAQFVGITGPIFERLFQKRRWKIDGRVPPFEKKVASFVRRTPLPAYDQAEREISKHLGATLSDAGMGSSTGTEPSNGEAKAG